MSLSMSNGSRTSYSVALPSSPSPPLPGLDGPASPKDGSSLRGSLKPHRGTLIFAHTLEDDDERGVILADAGSCGSGDRTV